jgi:hypothetical protein
MGILHKLAMPAAGALLVLAACGPGYGGTSVGVSAQLGPGIDVYGYSAAQYGDWHTNYHNWQPATVYESNGSYYARKVKGARQVQVYHSQAGYFMPPQDKDWANTDKRFNSKKMPTAADYGRARPHQ